MKKLIAMIGAVAMAFGLFAADPFAISFEQAEDSQNMGVDTESMLFTPPTGATEWSWTGDPLPLVGYEDGEAFVYGEDKLARRDNMFKDQGLVDNANYLKLATGTEELTRAVGEGNMYLDQLVKFTGFEDPQTNLVAGTKIAVWMSEFWNDDETEAETNLYVTVGKVDSLGNVEQIALKIHGTYELDTWYRISIKSLGDIYKGAEFTTPRAGFLVYVNGVQVYSDDIVARELAPVASMDGIAKSYMDNGLLFTSIAADDTFTSVSYKGIGAIDDVIIDAAGPEFCQAIPVTIVLPEDDEGNVLITIDKVMVGSTVLPQPWEVPDNTEISVFFSPVNGKKITTGASPVVATITSSDSTVDLSDGSIVVEDVVAKLNDTTDLAESELAGALAELQENEFIETVAACSIVEGEEEEETTLYSFTPNTKITATETGLSIYVGNYDEETTMAGMLECYAGVASGVTLAVELEDTDQGMFLFAGDVAGTLEANAVEVTDAIMVSGTLTAEALTIGETIQLVGTGKVVTKNGELAGKILPAEDKELAPLDPVEDWYTYTSVDPEPEIEYVTFEVTKGEGVDSFTVKTNGEDVVAAENAYTVESNAVVTITATAKTGYNEPTITSDDVTIEGGVFTADADDAEITIEAAIKTFTVTFNPNNGDANIVSNDVPYGTAFDNVKPADPTKAHYSFLGWDPDVEKIDGTKLTFTAQWKEDAKYTVTFSTNGVANVIKTITDVYTGTTLTADQIPEVENGTWDINPTNAVITCNTNFNATVVAPAPVDPVDPGEEKSYEKPEEAQAAAEYINDNKATMIHVPATVPAGSENAYLDRVAAKVVGETKVVVDIADGVKDTFQDELDEQMEDAAAELTDATAATASITTVPGFYYWIEGGVEVGTIKTNGEAVLGDGTKQELTKPTLETTTKAFYKLAVGVKDPASTPKEDK